MTSSGNLDIDRMRLLYSQQPDKPRERRLHEPGDSRRSRSSSPGWSAFTENLDVGVHVPLVSVKGPGCVLALFRLAIDAVRGPECKGKDNVLASRTSGRRRFLRHRPTSRRS